MLVLGFGALLIFVELFVWLLVSEYM